MGEDFDESYYTFNSNWTEDYLENLDTSEYPFPNVIWHVKPPKEIAIKTSLMILIGASGLFFNSIILLIITRNRWLWCASNYLIFNMALLDFATLLFCPWFMLVRDFYQNYVLRRFGCHFEGFLQASLLLASVAAVMLVSYDRLAAAGLSAEARVTKKAAPKLIVVSWFMSAALALPWALKRTFVEREWLDYIEMYCSEDVVIMGVYWHITLMILVWVPLGIMMITYGTIMWRLEFSLRALKSRGGGRAIARARGKALRITACVLLVAIVCRVPYTGLIYWRNNLPVTINAVDGSFNNMWFAANFLINMNCTINPLIYGFTNVRFRKAMDRTTPISWCKFGSWCCVCPTFNRKLLRVEVDDKNTDKIFVIENSPRPNRKLKKILKNMLYINKETLDFSVVDNEEITVKPTKCTPLKIEHI